MSTLLRAGSVSLLLVATSCDGDDGISFVGKPCSELSRDLAHEEPAAIGVSGADVVAWAEDTYRAVDVRWSGDVEPTSESFAFTFGAPHSTRELSAEGCSPSDWVEVTLPLELTSSSGHLSAEGTAVLKGFLDDEQELVVFVEGPRNAAANSDVGGPYLQAAHDHSPGLGEIHLTVGIRGWGTGHPHEQFVTVGGEWEHEGQGWAQVLYACKRVGNTCLVPSDPQP